MFCEKDENALMSHALDEGHFLSDNDRLPLEEHSESIYHGDSVILHQYYCKS